MNLYRLHCGYSIPINKTWKDRIVSRNYYWRISDICTFNYEKFEKYLGGDVTIFAVKNNYMYPNNTYQKHILYRYGLRNEVNLNPKTSYRLYVHTNEFYCA